VSEKVGVDIEPGSAVVLITGVMAAGKSTVAELMAGRLPRAAHVRGDVFRRMIVSGREELQTAEARSNWNCATGCPRSSPTSTRPRNTLAT
jgi:adenylylsulfate kinase-like enzyme